MLLPLVDIAFPKVAMALGRLGSTMEYDYLLKIILIGDTGVGKSSLLLRYTEDTFEEAYVCTIGVDFKIKTIKLSDKVVKLQIWDTAGQERFKPITRCYFRGSHGAIVVFDVTNRTTFTSALDWVKEYKEHNPSEQTQSLVLIGNKADSSDRTVSAEDGKSLALHLRCEYFETSAKCNTGIDGLFEAAAKEIIGKMQPNDAIGREMSLFKVKSTALPISGEPENKKRSCC